jgi:hypothetical protein
MRPKGFPLQYPTRQVRKEWDSAGAQ